MLSPFLYLIISLSIFIFYCIVITIFGFSIFTAIWLRGKKRPYINLKIVLKSFTIGLSLHIAYSMIITNFKIFNFYTVYLPFLILDLIFLTKQILNHKKFLISIIENFKIISLIQYLKKIWAPIIILGITFLLHYLLKIYFIDSYLAYAVNDSYYWFGNTWILHENGYIDYNTLSSYTPGFVLFNASVISITDDYYLIYFYLKYIPIFLSSINILVLYSIAKSLFKKKISILFCLIIYLSFNYLFFRQNMPVSSILATTLGFLYLLFIRENFVMNLNNNTMSLKNYLSYIIKKKEIFFFGIIISCISMAHPLYGLFYLTLLFFYNLFILITKVIKINIKTIIKFSILHIVVFLFVVIMLFPFFLSHPLNSNIFISIIRRISTISTYDPAFIESILLFFKEVGEWLMNGTFYSYIHNYFASFAPPIPENKRFFYYANIYLETIEIGIFLILLSIFMNFRKKFKFSEKKVNLIRFIKFTFVFVVVFFIFIDIIQFFTGFYYELIPIYNYISHYSIRLFELFSGYWAILFVLGFEYIIRGIKNILNKKRKHLKSFNKKSFRALYLSLVIITSGFFYLTNYERVSYNNRFNNDNKTDAVLFAANFFNENPVKYKITIALESDHYRFYYLIEFDYLKEVYYYFNIETGVYQVIEHISIDFRISYNFTNVYSFFDFINCDYIVYNGNNLNQNLTHIFSNHFITLYENNGGYIFSERTSVITE